MKMNKNKNTNILLIRTHKTNVIFKTESCFSVEYESSNQLQYYYKYTKKPQSTHYLSKENSFD